MDPTVPPRLIHQTWKRAGIDPAYRGFVDSVRRLNPGYEYRLWTDGDNREFIRDRYPDFLPIYDGYRHPIERADAIRYFILYTFGGIYLDLDMECLRPLDPLCRGDSAVFSLEAGPTLANRVVSNAFMATPAGHPFFARIIQFLARGPDRDVTFRDVFENTGPNMVTRLFRESRGAESLAIVDLDRVCPAKMLGLHPRFRGRTPEEIRDDGRLVLIHHNTESWNTQIPCPDRAPAGYVLIPGHDVPGCDIDYVADERDPVAALAAACVARDDAVAFNYNGFIKGGGGRLVPQDRDDGWIKPDRSPWVCIRRDRIAAVEGAGKWSS